MQHFSNLDLGAPPLRYFPEFKSTKSTADDILQSAKALLVGVRSPTFPILATRQGLCGICERFGEIGLGCPCDVCRDCIADKVFRKRCPECPQCRYRYTHEELMHLTEFRAEKRRKLPSE